jgi:hypothetical protein
MSMDCEGRQNQGDGGRSVQDGGGGVYFGSVPISLRADRRRLRAGRVAARGRLAATSLGWCFAIPCGVASAALGVLAHRSGGVFGLPGEVLWRLPFSLGVPVALAYLVATALRSERVIFGDSVIHRAGRPLAFYSSVTFLVLLACLLIGASVFMIYFGHGRGS